MKQFFCSLFTIRQVTFSHTDAGTRGHAPFNTRIWISMETTNQWLHWEGQKTSYICKARACCVEQMLYFVFPHISPAPDVSTSQALTLVRLRSQPRAEASLRAAEVLLCQPWKQFLIFQIHIQAFGFGCCRFWLMFLLQARCGLKYKNAFREGYL